MSYKAFSIFSSGGHFVQRSKIILPILVKCHPRNVSVKFVLRLAYGESSWYSIFSSDGHFVQWSKTILAILVVGSSKEHFCEVILK